MRSLLLIMLMLAIVSCSSSDPPAVFIEADYQVRCLICEPRAPDDEKRRIQVLDEDQGYSVDCSVTSSGKDRLVSFSLIFDTDGSAKDHRIEVEEAPIGDDEPGSKCLVRVGEKANTYLGKCTSSDPVPGAECQVKFDEKDGIVEGTIFCDEIPNKSIESSTRHLVLSDRFGTEHEDLTPATFAIHGCIGL